MKNKLIRLSKLISHAGICSRRRAEELINDGRVKINSKICKKFFVPKDEIRSIKVFDKELLKQTTRVWILNKPIGFVSSNKEQKKQKSLFRLIPNDLPRLVSVGRLDLNSEGLMILTNNPTLSTFLENPENKIERTYIVEVSGEISKNIEKKIISGIVVDGIVYQNVKIFKKNDNLLEIKLVEGKNREIRRILNYFDLQVINLKRVSFGPFKLENIKIGQIFEINYGQLQITLESLKFKDEDNFREIKR
ncbi:MAG: pseudouridine synthase [Pseudomonadota bacterium]|nr:pseudouridine synthase [Pseudomonadota bacterium]